MGNTFFEWDNDFNTGNATIDTEHFALVGLINQLFELSVDHQADAASGKPLDTPRIEAISQQLRAYVVNHFATEEAMMRDYAIDNRFVAEHLRAHSEFVDVIAQLTGELAQVSTPQAHYEPESTMNEAVAKINEVVEYLIRWLAYHILNVDKSLVRQLEDIQQRGLSPVQAYEAETAKNDASQEPLLKALKVLYRIVHAKNQEIQRKNSELEEKVKQRTAELVAANERLNALIFEDVLTGLPNRRFVMEEVQRLIYQWQRYKMPFSILFMDVDKFKGVNDTYGHDAGDQVLKWIAAFLKRNVRKTDYTCRLAGDEFVILCPHVDGQGALQLGHKLNQLLAAGGEDPLDFWKPSLSIGVAEMDALIANPGELLNKADSAMYISKTKGGNASTLA